MCYNEKDKGRGGYQLMETKQRSSAPNITVYDDYFTDVLSKKIDSKNQKGVATTLTANVPLATMQNVNRKSRELQNIRRTVLLDEKLTDLNSCVGKIVTRAKPVINHSGNFSVKGMFPDINLVVYCDSTSAVLFDGDSFWTLAGNADKLFIDDAWVEVTNDVLLRAFDQNPTQYYSTNKHISAISAQQDKLPELLKDEIDTIKAGQDSMDEQTSSYLVALESAKDSLDTANVTQALAN